MEQINQQGVKMYFSPFLAADYSPPHTTAATIEITKFGEKSYGQFTFPNDLSGYDADHLTIARWHVKPKPVDVVINNIISTAAKSCRS